MKKPKLRFDQPANLLNCVKFHKREDGEIEATDCNTGVTELLRDKNDILKFVVKCSNATKLN